MPTRVKICSPCTFHSTATTPSVLKTLMGGDTNKLKLAILFQMASRVRPLSITGMKLDGGVKKIPTAACFPLAREPMDQELRQWVRMLISLRKRTPSLRTRRLCPLLAEGDLYVFARTLGEESVVTALNASGRCTRPKSRRCTEWSERASCPKPD